MNDKKAFKILTTISILLCIFIVVFNMWIGPSMTPSYKEYKKIFYINPNENKLSVDKKQPYSYNKKADEELIENIKNEEGYGYNYDDEDDDLDDDESEDDDEDFLIININEADEDELTMLPNIGEVLARKIVEYREEHGLFKTKEDLLDVQGIGNKKLETMLDYISID